MSEHDNTPASRASASPPESGRRFEGGEGSFGLIVSVLLFGYFGFFAGLGVSTTPGGPTVPMFAFFLWTLRVSAIGFAIALALHALHRRWESTLLAGVVGVLSAVAFAAAAAWDMVDQTHALAISPILLVLFALWNGYVSWGSLRWALGVR